MAEIAVNYLLNKLTKLLENDVQFLRGAEEEAISARRTLERITAFLRVADSSEESDEEVKVWVKQIREIAYDAEDVLDEFQLLLAHDHGTGLSGFLNKMSCCVRNTKARYRIASKVQSLNSSIHAIYDGNWRLQDKLGRADTGIGFNKPDKAWQDHRGDVLLLDKNELIGIEEPIKQLTEWLVEGATRQETISILGMGGLGKTTLVKQVYEDSEVQKHFRICFWINLSQYAQMEDLLQEILRQIMKATPEQVPSLEEATNCFCLKKIIRGLLQRVKYLVVLDDAWHINEWDSIKYVLPNTNGSRIIITTRNADIAYAPCKEFQGKVHKMEPLPSEQSWKLFCAKIFQGKSCPSHLEETCRRILRKCNGLPLAIVAIGAVLASKDTERIDEWDSVLRSLRAELDCNDKLKNLKRVLLLSYYNLPYYLKSCVLHFSIFPKGHLIRCRRLIRIWIAEGFIQRKECKTLEEVAEDYLIELVNRSLIEVVAKRSDGSFYCFRIHNLFWDIITSKSRSQGYAEITKEENYGWQDIVRHLSIQSNQQALLPYRSLSRLRSLYAFRVEMSFMNTVLASEMRLLRVLDMQAAPLKRFPAQVTDWCHLKFLSFRYTDVNTVPNSIQNLQNLETLDLKYTNVTKLPVEILKLQRLRHLLVYRYSMIPYSWYKQRFKALGEIGNLQSLQKLCFLEADGERSCQMMEELGKLTQLNRLGVVKLRKEAGRDLCLAIAKLTKLRAVSLASLNKNEILDLQHLASPPEFLQRIYLTGRLGTLPHWLTSIRRLTRLHLRWSRLREDTFLALENLPNLVHLELLQAYEGTTLYFKKTSFLKLRFLGLDHFEELKYIEVENGAMPCLEKLIIFHCTLLEKLPSGIEYLTKLKVLEFLGMPDEFVKKLMPGEQDSDYERVAHVSEIYYGLLRNGVWDIKAIKRPADRGPCQSFIFRTVNFHHCESAAV